MLSLYSPRRANAGDDSDGDSDDDAEVNSKAHFWVPHFDFSTLFTNIPLANLYTGSQNIFFVSSTKHNLNARLGVCICILFNPQTGTASSARMLHASQDIPTGAAREKIRPGTLRPRDQNQGH